MSVEEFVEAPAERLVAMINANDVERSYAYCREVARREAKNFYYSFVALPKAKRDAICAVYAFMRKADDLSDDESKSHAQRRQEQAEWMASWQRTDRVEFSGGTGDDPIFPALLDAKRRFHISSQLLEQLVAGTAMDLDRPVASAGIFDTYATFGDLYQYCYLVASVVGLVCIRIFGYEDIRAEKLAEETGIAFQLTNILRDVREDAERNRIYLPLDQLARYDVTPGEIVGLTRGEPMQARHKAVLAETAQHAEEFYQSASQLLKLIEPDSRPALWVLVTIYHRLLLRIESADYDVFSQRISVPTYEKIALLLQGIARVYWFPRGFLVAPTFPETARLSAGAPTARNFSDVIVVGAGVAGLAAGCALSGAGYAVTMLERKPFVGGRASSYEHPSLHEVVDCQHVLLGCCTNLIDLLERTGASDLIRWYDTITFLERGGRSSEITPSGLPPPLHSSFSFLRAKMLDAQDKIGIARGMAEFLRGMPVDDSESVAQWMKRSGQTERAIRHFWEPTLIVTLNDNFENCSLWYAVKVFRELFLKTVEGSRLGIPSVPLGDLYSRAAAYVTSHGGTVVDRTSVDRIGQLEDGRWCVGAADEKFMANAIVLATSVDQMQRLLPFLPESKQLADSLGHFITSPYITTHLWFDREFTDLHHAALLRIRSTSGCFTSRVSANGRQRRGVISSW